MTVGVSSSYGVVGDPPELTGFDLVCCVVFIDTSLELMELNLVSSQLMALLLYFPLLLQEATVERRPSGFPWWFLLGGRRRGRRGHLLAGDWSEA